MSDDNKIPSWMITFSDVMTLLLTFFVLLLSMSVIDNRRKIVTLGSVSGTFGSGYGNDNKLADPSKEEMAEAGELLTAKDPHAMQTFQNKEHEDRTGDINILENKFITNLSITQDALFEPGSAVLTEKGIKSLHAIVPSLLRAQNPFLVSGHTGPEADEFPGSPVLDQSTTRFSRTWQLSIERTIAVYAKLQELGVPSGMMSMEAFAEYQPMYSNTSKYFRNFNRRVDIISDKRDEFWNPATELRMQKELRSQPTKPAGPYLFFSTGNSQK